jgi:tetratricopeptide (TPR) repeat protein
MKSINIYGNIPSLTDYKPYVITSEKGYGKSNILKQWLLQNDNFANSLVSPGTNSNPIILYSFLSNIYLYDCQDIMLSFIEQFKFLGFSNIIEHGLDIETQFKNIIDTSQSNSNSNQIIILIDNIDNIKGMNIDWLKNISTKSNIKIIATSTNVELNLDKNWQIIKLEQRIVTDKTKLINNIIKPLKLTNENINKIHCTLYKSKLNNPYYLTILINYLNLSKNFDDIKNYLDNTNISLKIIKDIEQKHQGQLTHILILLCITKNGLGFSDIRKLLCIENNLSVSDYLISLPFVVCIDNLYKIIDKDFYNTIVSHYKSQIQNASIKLLNYIVKLLTDLYYEYCNEDKITVSNITEFTHMNLMVEAVELLEKDKIFVSSNQETFDAFNKIITNVLILPMIYEKKFNYTHYWMKTNLSEQQISKMCEDNITNYPIKDKKYLSNYFYKLGNLFRELDFYLESIKYYKQAIELKYEIYGKESLDVTLSLNDLGRLYFCIQDFDNALIYLQKAYNIRGKFATNSNDNDILFLFAITTNNIGLCYDGINQIDKAIEMYNNSIDLYKKTVNSEPELSISYHNIALSYSKIFKFEKSLEYYQLAIKIKQSHYGYDHPELVMTLNNIGLVYTKFSSYQKAMEYYSRAEKIINKYPGQKNVESKKSLVLFNMGVCYMNLGDMNNCKKCLFQSLKIRKILYKHKPDHQNIKNVQSWINSLGLTEDVNTDVN